MIYLRTAVAPNRLVLILLGLIFLLLAWAQRQPSIFVAFVHFGEKCLFEATPLLWFHRETKRETTSLWLARKLT